MPGPFEGMTQVVLVSVGQSASLLQAMGCWALMMEGRSARARVVKRYMANVLGGA